MKFEEVFLVFHNGHKLSIDQDPDVIARMHQQLGAVFPEWPSEILQFLAKTLTFFRIKYLKHKLKFDDAKAKLRKLKQTGQFLS